MHIHSIKQKDLDILEQVFAYLTPEGWKIPKWLLAIRAAS